jgi:hypothetical protein
MLTITLSAATAEGLREELIKAIESLTGTPVSVVVGEKRLKKRGYKKTLDQLIERLAAMEQQRASLAAEGVSWDDRRRRNLASNINALKQHIDNRVEYERRYAEQQRRRYGGS